ncbi:hypothetical protein HELRODRAFT_86254, partial [Helobdella robusta]|uniref:Vps72/YL1 C-terminal domain-containing protein n=1 Tax=Helobdella robusta TaxID=6412 RepID=T1G694_HELRO
KKPFKNLKQIIQAEKSEKWKEDDYEYLSIDALPSFLPAKKYSDLSGLPAPYTDPHTKLRYATSEEYSRIKSLPSDIVMGLLNLRKGSTTNS